MLRAILEANASIALWLQWLIVQVLATDAGGDVEPGRTWTVLGGLISGWSACHGQSAVTTVDVLPHHRRASTRGDPGGCAGEDRRMARQTFAVLADPTNPAYAAATAS